MGPWPTGRPSKAPWHLHSAIRAETQSRSDYRGTVRAKDWKLFALIDKNSYDMKSYNMNSAYMAEARMRMSRKLPAWLRGEPVPASIAPHRVPFPLARCFQQICATASAETLAGEGVKSTKLHPYAALACIQDSPGVDQARLAVMIGMDRASVGTLIDELEQAGLVERRVNDADRRARELYITPRGDKLRRRIRPKLLEAQARVLAVLKPAEQDQLIDLLTRVVEANATYVRPGAGRRRPQKRGSADQAVHQGV